MLGGFKSLGELRTNPFGLPHAVGSGRITRAFWGRARYWQLLGNSLMPLPASTVAITLGGWVHGGVRVRAISISSAAACCLAISRSGLLFPAATAILPLFITVRDLGLLDSYFGVALTAIGVRPWPWRSCCCAVSSSDLPGGDLMEAAQPLTVAAYLRAFFRYITIPLSRPIIATVGTIAFVQSWNAYLMPLGDAQQ